MAKKKRTKNQNQRFGDHRTLKFMTLRDKNGKEIKTDTKK